jgi:hypothetical protein
MRSQPDGDAPAKLSGAKKDSACFGFLLQAMFGPETLKAKNPSISRSALRRGWESVLATSA